MDRYIIGKIKEYKLKNDVLSNCIVHEYYKFEYNGKVYVNIYVKCFNGCKLIEINNKAPLMCNFLKDDVCVVCYLYDDVKDNMLVTKYDSEVIKNDNLVDYTDYEININNINILSSLGLRGFKQINVIPKVKENFWICACGKANVDRFCKLCGVNKDFASLYDNEKKIHQKFALREYERIRFNSENVDEEIKLFKQRIKNNKRLKINLDYLDKEFFDSINKETLYKAEVVKNKNNNKRLVRKYTLLIILAIVIIISVICIISAINKANYLEDIIDKNCSNSKYSKANNIDAVISDGRCGTLIYYMENNELTDSELLDLSNSDNMELYKGYYSYKKENIHETLFDENSIDSDKYLKYLYENDFETIDDVISYKLSDALISKDKDRFRSYASYLTVGEKTWDADNNYFDNGYDKVDPETYKYVVGMEKNAKNYTEFSLIYHEESGDNTCTRADLFSEKNLKYLFDKKDNKACQYALSDAIADISVDDLNKYVKSSGSLDYNSYLGNFIHHLVDDYYVVDDPNGFEAKLKVLNVNGAINQQMKSDSGYPGYTPLDVLIDDYEDECEYAQSKYFSSGSYVKRCNSAKAIYSKMKNHGAKCNKKCSNEKYFK